MRMQDGSPGGYSNASEARSVAQPMANTSFGGGAHATKMTSRRERCPRPRASTVDCFAALSEPATFDVL